MVGELVALVGGSAKAETASASIGQQVFRMFGMHVIEYPARVLLIVAVPDIISKTLEMVNKKVSDGP